MQISYASRSIHKLSLLDFLKQREILFFITTAIILSFDCNKNVLKHYMYVDILRRGHFAEAECKSRERGERGERANRANDAKEDLLDRGTREYRLHSHPSDQDLRGDTLLMHPASLKFFCSGNVRMTECTCVRPMRLRCISEDSTVNRTRRLPRVNYKATILDAAFYRSKMQFASSVRELQRMQKRMHLYKNAEGFIITRARARPVQT